MAQDTGPFHELPIMGALKSPGRYFSKDNGHPKQPQQHYPPCTTQASLPAMTDDQEGALSGYRTLAHAPSPRRHETIAPEDILCPPQSPVLGLGTLQDVDAATVQREQILENLVHKKEHYSDELHHRIKDMWPSQPGDPDDCDHKYDISQKTVSGTASRRFSQPVHTGQHDNAYEKLGSHSRDWMTNSQNSFPQPFAWDGLPPATSASLNQSVYYQNCLELVNQGSGINTSASYDPGMVNLDRSFEDEINPNYVFNPTTACFPGFTASVENVPITTFSPSTSLSFYDPPPAMRQDREDTAPLSEADLNQEHKDDVWWQDQSLDGSPSSMDVPGSKVDEPYAQLIYRAFLSRHNKSMTLQEIYQWFRENTDKSKAAGKGWQNSIRHNLSMNGAFTKRNSKTPLSGNGDGSVSLDNAGVDGRKSTEWFLEPAFYAGVESTTRYRKGNSGSRPRGAGSHPGRSRQGLDGHGGASGGFSHARVSAGRKGGNVAAQNRKRLAERQQHARQMEMAREHPRHLQHQGYHSLLAMPYGGLEERGYSYPQYPAPTHFAPSPFPPPPPSAGGFGGVPAATGQQQGARQTDIVYNYFNSDDVGRDVHSKRSRTLGTDNDGNEPVTPPGSTLDSQESADFGSKHREILPEMAASYNPLHSYQVSLDLEQQQQQQQPFPGVVTGVYDPPVGGPQPPIFVEEDINLSPVDALLMNLDFGE